jgi:hypothetical protein
MEAGVFMEAAEGGDSLREATMKGTTMNTIKACIQKLSIYAVCNALTLVILAGPGFAQQPTSRTFPSTTEAAQSLFQAVQRNDEAAIESIVGGSTDLTSSSDEMQDRVERDMFVKKYQEMHRVGREPDGAMTLYIGAENWPFPIPLLQKNGAWHFDADAGRKEILFRRIGENELTAITMCHQFVANERSYRENPGTASEEGISPASLVATAATNSGDGDPVLIHGYYFHVSSKRLGAFTLIAYPAGYRSTGVMTFVVTEKGVVYEKDLGPNTSATAASLAGFHKDGTWVPTTE